MAVNIEDYAIIGDCKTAALVGRDGSIDWLCWPRFDSAACFAALLGPPENGRWLIAPEHPVLNVSRCYRPGTLILETEFKTASGSAAIIDFMPPGDGADVVRVVIGRSGRVEFRTELVQVQIVYGVGGERWLPEMIVPWLADYENSSPVRIGNAAYQQLQIDVLGEVANAMFQVRKAGMKLTERGRALRPLVLEYLEMAWREPDEGIWEVRGRRQHFVHSKVMAWVAFDRAANELAAEGSDESARRWREIADEIHAQVCERGFDHDLSSFVLLPHRRVMVRWGDCQTEHRHVQQINRDHCHDGHRYWQEFVPRCWPRSTRRDHTAAPPHLNFPRVPSLEGFGRRRRVAAAFHMGPSSETLHKCRLRGHIVRPEDANALPFRIRTGGDGPSDTHVICGFFSCDARPFDPLPRSMRFSRDASQGPHSGRSRPL
jgi:GH15 family glucan-1,4-alpha-glucosidase